MSDKHPYRAATSLPPSRFYGQEVYPCQVCLTTHLCAVCRQQDTHADDCSQPEAERKAKARRNKGFTYGEDR